MTIKSLLSRIFPPQQPGTPMFWVCCAIAVGICVVIFIGLTLAPQRLRRPIIVTATFLAGLFYAVEFFLPAGGPKNENALTFAVPTVGNLLSILKAFTLGLGIISLVRVHAGNIIKAKPGFENSIILLIGMVTMAVAGLYYDKTIFFRSLFRDMLANFDAAMFAMLAFYIVGAAYRAFRIRSAEATLLMLSALVVMLGQVPIGQAITSGLPQKGSFLSLLRLDNISNWLLTSINAPAMRAIEFGIGIGLLGIALRLWLSLERGAYFEARTEEAEG
jgi:hypothetical protein